MCQKKYKNNFEVFLFVIIYYSAIVYKLLTRQNQTYTRRIR